MSFFSLLKKIFFFKLVLEMKSKLSAETRAQLKELFASIDLDKSNNISLEELGKKLEESSIYVGEGELKIFFKNIKKGEDREINFEEFCEFYEFRVKKMRETFDLIDSNKDGVVSVEEIRQMLDKLGLRASDGNQEWKLKI